MCRLFHLLSVVIALATIVSPHSLHKFGENTRSISHCKTQLRGPGQQDHGSKRRAETVTHLRRDLINTQQGHRNVRNRDLSDILHHNHEFTREAVRENGDDVLLFADHTSYTLQGEMIEGPYYVNGELVRSNISQGQEGVPLFLDIQLIDTSTCHPIADAFVDIWQANATGVYSGVVGLDNGNFEDKSNVNTNFLRGIQQTNSNGVVQFQTIFPGHYEGRTTHIHLLVHNIASTIVRSNNTIESSDTEQEPRAVHASHVGQLFFDASLIGQVEARYPYSANSQHLILNSEDAVLIKEADSSDPLVQYVFLGKTVQEGIFAWITLGIDPEMDIRLKSSASWYDGFGKQWRKLWY
ncbi:hypothetical protein N8I77_005091 [Diaporthe amygdali]|uniref:Intradiol ring-cleavage dioxygenases domain-containing protein n=1 Tax=Phomopsis amygdali TaxID=1214568 RepID=A0AAD9W6N1_PHOAM|nr:hypothetical protein N8I77_005091 [Diaporthe amygdali]